MQMVFFMEVELGISFNGQVVGLDWEKKLCRKLSTSDDLKGRL